MCIYLVTCACKEGGTKKEEIEMMMLMGVCGLAGSGEGKNGVGPACSWMLHDDMINDLTDRQHVYRDALEGSGVHVASTEIRESLDMHSPNFTSHHLASLSYPFPSPHSLTLIQPNTPPYTTHTHTGKSTSP